MRSGFSASFVLLRHLYCSEQTGSSYPKGAHGEQPLDLDLSPGDTNLYSTTAYSFLLLSAPAQCVLLAFTRIDAHHDQRRHYGPMGLAGVRVTGGP